MNLDEKCLREAMNTELGNRLRPVTWGLAGFYGVWSVASLFGPERFLVSGSALASAVIYLAVALWLRRHPPGPRGAHRFAVFLAGVAYAHSTFNLVLTREVAHRGDYVILVLGAALLFYSVRYLLVVLCLAVFTWFALVWQVDGTFPSAHEGVVWVAASAVALWIQRCRRESSRQLLLARTEAAQGREELSATIQRLSASEEKFRRFAEMSGEGIVFHDNGIILELNERCAEIFGWSVAELVGKPLTELVVPLDRDRLLSVFQTESPERVTGVRKDGTEVVLEVVGRRVRWENRDLHLLTMRNVTLRQREIEEMRHVLAGVRGLLWYATVTNRDGAFEWDIHVSDPEAAQRFLPLDVQPYQTYEQAWYESKSPEYRTRMDEVAIGALLRGQTRYSQEYPCRRSDGNIQWLYEDVHVEAVGANCWQLIGVCTDVTELKRVERALRESEEQFRTLFENAPIGMMLISPEGRVIRVNYGFSRMLGYLPRELLSSSFLDFVHPGDALKERELFEQLGSRALDAFRTESRAVTKDGRIVWGNVVMFPVFNSMGELQFYVRMVEDITERKIAEELERGASQRIEAILRSAADGIVTVNTEGIIEEFNPAAEQMFGYSAAEAVGKSLFDLAINGEMRTPEELNEQMRRAGEEGVVQLEAIGVRSDESTFIAELVISELRLADERSFTVIIRDVTERRNAEITLAASEERFRAVFESAAIGIDILSPEGKILRANDALANFLGYTRDELEGMHFHDISYPDDLARDENLFNDQISGRRSQYALEKRYRHRNGTIVWGFLTSSVVRDPSGKVLYVVRMVEDINERKLALEALRESEERYRDLFENATDLIQSVRPDGTFAYVNRAWMQTLGYTHEDLPRLRLMDIIHPDCRAQCEEIFHRVLSGESVSGIQADFVTSRGERITVEGNVSCRFEKGEPVATRAILRDVTERKQLERLKDEFVSTVSHELRTPLTSIFGSLGLLVGGAAGPLPETVQRMLHIAYSNSERLIRLVNDILDMQKIESGRMEFHLEVLEIAPIVAEAVEANRAYAERYGVTIQVEDHSNGAKARIDHDRFIQVLTNLLSNASKFTNPGTPVEVRIDTSDSDVRVAVQDHGPGIPKEFRSRIFQKFAQADSSDSRQKGGTGLGLSITKAIVERLGGKIEYESELGKGTTFTVTLPLYRESPAMASSLPTGARRARLLLCEDDPDVATLISTLLADAGYESDVATTAAQASELLKSGAYDALVLDLILPDASGIRLLSALRAQEATRALPVVVVSVVADEEKTRLSGSALEVVDWINKPFQPERLLNAIALATRRSARPRPSILHVEDDIDVLHVVAAMLDIADVTFATTLQEAKSKLASVKYDLVILDIVLPDGSGLELLPLLTESSTPTPVVIFSAYEVSSEITSKVNAALVKSKTTNAQFVALIRTLLQKRIMPTGIVAGESE